jgi:hypothetical protein
VFVVRHELFSSAVAVNKKARPHVTYHEDERLRRNKKARPPGGRALFAGPWCHLA